MPEPSSWILHHEGDTPGFTLVGGGSVRTLPAHSCMCAYMRVCARLCVPLSIWQRDLCTDYSPSFHLCQSHFPLSEECSIPPTCWCCCRVRGPLASRCPWFKSLGSGLSSTICPSSPPSAWRCLAKGVCRIWGCSLGLAGLWEEKCSMTCHAGGHGREGQHGQRPLSLQGSQVPPLSCPSKSLLSLCFQNRGTG